MGSDLTSGETYIDRGPTRPLLGSVLLPRQAMSVSFFPAQPSLQGGASRHDRRVHHQRANLLLFSSVLLFLSFSCVLPDRSPTTESNCPLSGSDDRPSPRNTAICCCVPCCCYRSFWVSLRA